MRYVLLTKFWNEKHKIRNVVNTIVRQELRPVVWLLLDDGSTDGSLKRFKRLCTESHIPTLSVQMPQKTKGNIDALGRVYQLAFDTWKEYIRQTYAPHYFAMLDVDSQLPADYFQSLVQVLDQYPLVGAIAGQVKDENRQSSPQGSGKMVRWSVIESFDKIWDLDADSFLNIKANALGYWCVIVNNLHVYAEPSLFYSAKGAFRFGRRMFYVRRPFPIMFLVLLRGILRRKMIFLNQFRGWSLEAARNNWRCNDTDVLEFYGIMRYLNRKQKRTKVVEINESNDRLVCKTMATS